MSVVLFATATEMRFLEAAAKEEELAENKKVKPATLEGPKKSYQPSYVQEETDNLFLQ